MDCRTLGLETNVSIETNLMTVYSTCKDRAVFIDEADDFLSKYTFHWQSKGKSPHKEMLGLKQLEFQSKVTFFFSATYGYELRRMLDECKFKYTLTEFQSQFEILTGKNQIDLRLVRNPDVSGSINMPLLFETATNQNGDQPVMIFLHKAKSGDLQAVEKYFNEQGHAIAVVADPKTVQSKRRLVLTDSRGMVLIDEMFARGLSLKFPKDAHVVIYCVNEHI